MQTIQIADGCSQVTSGATPSRKKPEYFIGDIPWLKTKELNDALIGATEEHISESALAETSCKLIPAGAVVIAMYGATVGKLGILGTPMATNQACCAMVADEVSLHSQYLFYWLLQNRRSIINLSNGAAQQNLSVRTIKNIALKIPTLEKQIHTADVLKSLDDKIAANQTSISKIDEILRALWQKELSLGNIDVPLSSLASFINGKAFTKDASGTGRVVVRIAEMNSGIGSRTVYSDIDAAPDNVVDPGELLFSWSGTLMTKRWPYEQAIVNQHIFKVVPNGRLDLWALRQAIDAQLEYFRMIAAGKATTMGHIKRGDLDQEVKVPAQMSEETNQLGNSLWALATSLEIQNLQLARTRDELLPLLMSGRITVGEAEDAADEAASES
ncbi:restriction endonuclease subunit S [Corynebacterium striatum]|uniref:restriction endonuclease subunit S n=1 Tax=Corynebacterium striatum TaxID=43770 RepID=UPI003AD4F2E1